MLNSYSFPSGHSTVAAASAGVAIVVALVVLGRPAARRAAVGVSVAFALVVGADRVFLGVHNVSDVLAGYALGALIVLTAVALVRPRTGPSAVTVLE